MAGKSDSQLNDIYKQQYLKSIGKDDASKKRKREEALEYLDEWIAETHQTRDAERMFQNGEIEWRQKFQLTLQHVRQEIGKSATTYEEVKQAAEKQVIEEMGTQEEYATVYVENNLAPRGLLGLIGAIRDLLE